MWLLLCAAVVCVYVCVYGIPGLSLYVSSMLLICDRLMADPTMMRVYSVGICLAFFYTAPPLKLKYFALVVERLLLHGSSSSVRMTSSARQ